MVNDERDATPAFALLHRLGFSWAAGRVDTLLPAVLAHPPRWVSNAPSRPCWSTISSSGHAALRGPALPHAAPAGGRRGQVLAVGPFLDFLHTLHPLDTKLTRTVFLPFLRAWACWRSMKSASAIADESWRGPRARVPAARPPGNRSALDAARGGHPAVIQPTLLELLTPAQNPHRLLQLAQLADVETLDTMVSFRLGPTPSSGRWTQAYPWRRSGAPGRARPRAAPALGPAPERSGPAPGRGRSGPG